MTLPTSRRTTPTAAVCTNTISGRVCQAQYIGYTLDGGHLNDTGKTLVAKSFYALGTALFSVDRDGDGETDGSELLAGTRPLDPTSVFKCVSTTRAASNAIVLEWTSSSNRLYTIQRGASLLGGFSNLMLNAPATPPINVYTDTPTPAGSFYYRVQVRQ